MSYRGGHNLGLYVLNASGEPVPERDTLAWGRWFETAKRHVGDDTVGPYRVSTVFLGIDHGFGAKGEPVLWETMIFGLPEGRRFRKDIHQEHYRTKADALAGHARAVATIRQGKRLLRKL